MSLLDYAAEVKKDAPSVFLKIDPGTAFPPYNSESYYSGLTVSDYSGNGRNGTLSGYLSDSGYANATPRFGKTAISFNALHPENLGFPLRMPRLLTDIAPTEIFGGGSWTLELWQRETQIACTSYNMEDLLYLGNADAVGPPWHGIRLGSYFVEVIGYDKRAMARSQTNRTGPFHLAWTYDGSVMTLYSNGASVVAYTGALSAFNVAVDSAQRLTILYKGDLRSSGRSAQSLGTISNFAFYPSALSLARLQIHYQAGISAATPLWRTPHSSFTTAFKELR